MKTDVDLIGDRELAQLFEKMPAAMQRRVLRPAVSAASRPVAKSAKGFAPVETRAMRKAIGVKTKTYKSGTVAAIVGVRRGPQFTVRDKHGRKRVPAFYQHIVHGGSKPHRLGKGSSLRDVAKGRMKVKPFGGLHPGTKPDPFLAKAWSATKPQAMAQARRVAAQKTVETARKLAK